MKIHHLNTITFCPIGGSLFSEQGIFTLDQKLVAHCLLIESNDGLVLVDTGFGTADVNQNGAHFNWAFIALARPAFSLEDTALYQVKKLGFKPSDVRHIILTHLDIDHAGGLSDFPEATVHIYGPEKKAAESAKDFKSKQRYNRRQWSHRVLWEEYKTEGDTWEGFRAIKNLRGLKDEIYILPLEGHTEGHAGILVKGEKDWHLHCGDAYFHHHEIHSSKQKCPMALEFYQSTLSWNDNLRRENRKLLQQLMLRKPDNLAMYCSHDLREYEAAVAGSPLKLF